MENIRELPSCETCKHSETCRKLIGIMYGYCNIDYEPDESTADEMEG